MGVGRRDDNTLGAIWWHTCGDGRIPAQSDVEGERHAAALALTARGFAAIVFASGGAIGGALEDFCVGRAMRRVILRRRVLRR
jgi:hypothetical protein